MSSFSSFQTQFVSWHVHRCENKEYESRNSLTSVNFSGTQIIYLSPLTSTLCGKALSAYNISKHESAHDPGNCLETHISVKTVAWEPSSQPPSQIVNR